MSIDSSGITEDTFDGTFEGANMASSTLISIGYLSGTEAYYEQRDQCLVPISLWESWIGNQTTGSVLLVELTQDTHTHTFCVGGYTEEPGLVLVPIRWCHVFNPSDHAFVRVVDTMPPIATRLVLQPLDNELYHCNIVENVSKYLSEWQVLTEGTTLTVPCEELGGFPVDIFVKLIEPASLVLLRDEVPIELEESMERVAEWIPTLPAQTPMAPVVETDTVLDTLQTKVSGFVPFSGTGNRLGS